MTTSSDQEILESKRELIDIFNMYDDWMDKYKFIIDLGNQMPEFPRDKLVDENQMHGCMSQVWLISELQKDGRLKFQATSDAAIVKGLAAIMIKIFSNRFPEDIIKTDLDFFQKIGLDSHLSMTRANGLSAMIKTIKDLALKAKIRNYYGI